MEDESIGRAIVNGELRLYLNVYPKTALSLSRIGTPTRTCDVTGYQHRCLRRMYDGLNMYSTEE